MWLIALLLATTGAWDECRSDRLQPAERSVAEVLRPGARAAVDSVWDASWGRTYATIWHTDSIRVTVAAEGALPAEQEKLEAVLAASVAVPPGEGETWDIVVAGDSVAELRMVEELKRCRATMENADEISDRLGELGRELGVRRATIRITALVDREGRIVDLRVEESSGSFRTDVALAELAREIRFRPMIVEGIPTRGWVTFPLTIGAPPP